METGRESEISVDRNKISVVNRIYRSSEVKYRSSGIKYRSSIEYIGHQG
ncbi:hypothetical protein [Peribacillus tepidiphilus]|nr:hypothetical protein [Peribacillus tepidiphilus]